MRLLRLLLPACLVVATCIAAVGLFRDVSQTDSQPASAQAPSLRLGPGPGPTVALPSGSPSPAPKVRPAPTPSRLTTPVVVYNASGISGLASRTAAVLRLRGVDVASIGNLDPAAGSLAGTAVYYPPGTRGQAQALAQLSGVSTISPAPAGLGPTGTLVLVLTDTQAAAVSAAGTSTAHGR